MSPEDIYGLSDTQYAMALAKLEKQEEEERRARQQNRIAGISKTATRFARDTYKERSTDIRRLLGKQEIGPDGKVRDVYAKRELPFLERIKNLNPFRSAENFVGKIDYSRPDLTFKINQGIKGRGATGEIGKDLNEAVDNLYDQYMDTFNEGYFKAGEVDYFDMLMPSESVSDPLQSAIDVGLNSPLPEGGPMMASLDGGSSATVASNTAANTAVDTATDVASNTSTVSKAAGAASTAMGVVGLGMNLYEMGQKSYKKMDRGEKSLHAVDTAASVAALANPALAPIKLLTSLARLID